MMNKNGVQFAATNLTNMLHLYFVDH